MQIAKKLVLIFAILMMAAIPLQAAELALSFTNLPALNEATDGLYEGWVIVDGAPVSTGVFNVNAMGQTVAPGTSTVITFTVDDSIGRSSAVKITIEPVGDMDPAPSGLVIMTGDVNDSVTPLVAALPDLATLMTAGGSYILATPSDNGVDTSNDNQGIWYLSMPGPTASLTNLPDLGPKWTYEGWIVDTSGMMPMPYSTGTFNMAAGTDSDAAGCNGGGPPFPGQDFTAFHCGPILDLDNGDFVAVISIEPVPDNGAGPFLFKPLAGMVPTDALMNGGMLNNQVAATFPTGSATITGVVATESSSWGDVKAAFR